MKIIPNTDSKYLIDEQGCVFSQVRNRLKQLRPGLITSGYQAVSIYFNGKRSTQPIHRLMAITFLSQKLDGRMVVVNHKNGIKQDNALSNLEVVTARENSLHAIAMGLSTPPKICKLTEQDVMEIYKQLDQGKGPTELAKQFGVTKGLITQIKQGIVWRHLYAALNEESK